MEDKIKALLSSEDEANQRLGCTLAKSALGWTNWNIMHYIMNSCQRWEFHEFEILGYLYQIHFLGGIIAYHKFDVPWKGELSFHNKKREAPNIIKMPNTDRLSNKKIMVKKFCDLFIKQNL